VAREGARASTPSSSPSSLPDEVQREHDRLFASLLLNARSVDTSTINPKKHSVVIRVAQVSEDAHNYYVRLSATNTTTHTYRLQNAVVMKIDPAFSADTAYKKRSTAKLGPKRSRTSGHTSRRRL